MKRIVIALALVMLTAGIAFAGHVDVRYQDGNVESLTPSKPVAAVTVIMSEKFLKIDYKDGSNETLYPDGVVTAVNVVINGEATGRVHINYVGGQGDDLTPPKPVRSVDVIVSQRFLNISFMDGTSEILQPNGEVSFIKVFID